MGLHHSAARCHPPGLALTGDARRQRRHSRCLRPLQTLRQVIGWLLVIRRSRLPGPPLLLQREPLTGGAIPSAQDVPFPGAPPTSDAARPRFRHCAELQPVGPHAGALTRPEPQGPTILPSFQSKTTIADTPSGGSTGVLSRPGISGVSVR